MSRAKRDITITLLLLAAVFLCVRLFLSRVSDDRSATAADPYCLMLPTPRAVLSVNRPASFKRLILPAERIGSLFTERIPARLLAILRELPDEKAFQIAYYEEGEVFYASLTRSAARHLFRHLDSAFPFAPQTQEESAVPIRYYPDSGKRFLGCYYHAGIFVASYDRGLLRRTLRRQLEGDAPLPPLAEARANSRNATINLFLPAEPLDLAVPIDDSTEWRIRGRWLSLDLFFSEGSLCCFSERTYEPFPSDTARLADTLLPQMRDTVEARVNGWFPKLKTAVQVGHDESTVFYTLCAQ